MINEKFLSGHELVSKGATKIEATMPEIGLKEASSTGSWLEQKQVQAAVEARKNLIEIERIEKSGTLSHAVWREDLMLAEVTQKVGSCWQYLGHNKGKKLYVKPEEVLFLMEINCLHLKFNEVKVSLQQAYSLLLRGKVMLLQYKVYSSLSRLGYRVFRHERLEPNECDDNVNLSPSNKKVDHTLKDNNVDNEKDIEPVLIHPENSVTNNEITKHNQGFQKTKEKNGSKYIIIDEDYNKKPPSDKQTQGESDLSNLPNQMKNKDLYGLKKLEKLKNRTLKPCNPKNIHRVFEKLPELIDRETVSIQAPQKRYIPNSIIINRLYFNINLQNLRNKNDRSVSTDTNMYSVNDEVNGSHIMRLRNTSNRSDSIWSPSSSNFEFDNRNTQYRQFNFWGPRQSFNSINFNMLFQRHYLSSLFFTPQVPLSRMQSQYWPTNFNNTNRNYHYKKKRTRGSIQKQHLEEIKILAIREKQLTIQGNTQDQNIQSVQTLIQTYNTRYKPNIKLTADFNIINEEIILDTIDLDDDEEPSRKKHRSNSPIHKFDENLDLLKQVASQLNELEINNQSSAKHRRAFSKLLSTFNKSYNKEYCLNGSYELKIQQKTHIDSSDSSIPECSTKATKFPSGKKLRNPFNILKILSERRKGPCDEASTSRTENCLEVKNKKYSEVLLKTFTKDWLPPEDDFGRADVVSQETVYKDVIDMRREDFLFDFLKIQTNSCDNWLHLKKSCFTSIEEAIAVFQSVPPVINNRINATIKSDKWADMASILTNLKIIRTEKGIKEDCNLAIDFDVFNRDIHNFKKTRRPSPHFRIICLDETKHIPSGDEIASVHSKYDDDVIIVFAIVRVGSISYIQINPSDLPVYISSNV